MEFRVLGPLEVVCDAEMLDIGGPRQHIVLAMLLLESPRVLPVEQLVDAVWSDSPPATARSQIQICVSSLRRRLRDCHGSATISTRRPGYALDLGGASLDLHAFDSQVTASRAAVTAGRIHDASQLLRRALGDWRGIPLAGIDSTAVRDAATRLEENRLAVLELYCDLELRLDRYADLITILGSEVDRNPLRERLRGQLMLALYRAGRQADALHEFRRARRTSVEELGIEPAEDLCQLERAILCGDTSLMPTRPPIETDHADQAPAVVPRLLPVAVADFTGREASVAAVTAQLTAPRPSRWPSDMPIVVLTGCGGMGKSALALHVAHRVAAAFPDGQLFACMQSATQPVRSGQVLERFLRALGVPASAIPETLDERAELYRNLLADRRVLVVLDDVTAEHQAIPLLPPGGGCAVLITSRRKLTAVPGATRVELQVFSAESAVALLGRVIGEERIRDAEDDATELATLCGHLPLAIRITAARLAARPHWSLGTMVERLSDEASQLDELRHGDMAVRASLMLSYEALNPEARRLLRLLVLIDGPDFGAWACPPLLHVGMRTAQDLLDDLVESHLVDVAIEGHPVSPLTARYRLHDLVRLFAQERAVTEDSPQTRTAAVARFLGALMFLAESAHRREHGGDFLILHGPATRYPLDERLVTPLLAKPLEWLAKERQTLVAAVAQASAEGMSSLCWDLAISSVTLFETHALFDDWRETHEVALAAARRENDQLGEALVLYSLGELHAFEWRRFVVAEALYAEAMRTLSHLGCVQGMAMVLRNQAFIDRVTGDYELSRSRNEQALALFRETGDRMGEAFVLNSLAQIDIDFDRDDDALDRLITATTICTQVQNRRLGAQVANRLGEVHLRRGDGAAAEDAFATVLAFARQTGDRIAEIYGLSGLGCVAIERGELDDARSTLLRADRSAAEVGEQLGRCRVLLLLSKASLSEGDLPRARQEAEQALRIAARLSTPRWTAACSTQIGDVHAAEQRPELAVESWTVALRQLRTITPPLIGQIADVEARLNSVSVR